HTGPRIDSQFPFRPASLTCTVWSTNTLWMRALGFQCFLWSLAMAPYWTSPTPPLRTRCLAFTACASGEAAQFAETITTLSQEHQAGLMPLLVPANRKSHSHAVPGTRRQNVPGQSRCTN